MKFLKISLLAALLLGAKQASALFDASAFGGYTTLSMSDINSEMDTLKAGIPSGVGCDVTHISSGFYVGADASISVLPFLKVGPRIEYVSGGEGKFHAYNSGGDFEDMTFADNLMMYEVGVSSDFALPLTGLSLQGGLWVGYGQAGGSMRFNDSAGNDFKTDVSGSGFVGELGVQARYKVIPLITLGLDLGYRLAKISNMTTKSDTPIFGPADSTPTLLFDDSNLGTYDFSGFNIGGSVSFNF